MMMKLAVTLVVLFVAVANAAYFKAEDCGHKASPITFHNFHVNPDPLVVNWLTNVTVSADVEVREEINDDFEVLVGIKKNTRLVTIPVPLKIRRSVCGVVKNERTSPIACSVLNAVGLKCECPVKPGVYKLVNHPVTIDIRRFKLPGLSALLKLGSGKYDTTVTINKLTDKSAVSCLRFKNESKVLMK